MSSEDEKMDTIFHYARTTYRKPKSSPDIDEPSYDANLEDDSINPSNIVKMDTKKNPSCCCNLGEDEEIAHILHKKCPVISLAHLQMQRLLNESDRFMSTNSNRYIRSVYDFVCFCKEVVSNSGNIWCIILIMTVVSFLFGLLMGAASCGTYLGKFNSPIFTCIDNYFIPDTYPTFQQTFRSIV